MTNNIYICDNCKKKVESGVSCLLNLIINNKPQPVFGGFSYKEENERVFLCNVCYERFKPDDGVYPLKQS